MRSPFTPFPCANKPPLSFLQAFLSDSLMTACSSFQEPTPARVKGQREKGPGGPARVPAQVPAGPRQALLSHPELRGFPHGARPPCSWQNRTTRVTTTVGCQDSLRHLRRGSEARDWGRLCPLRRAGREGSLQTHVRSLLPGPGSPNHRWESVGLLLLPSLFRLQEPYLLNFSISFDIHFNN